jgi:hypothetical protein
MFGLFKKSEDEKVVTKLLSIVEKFTVSCHCVGPGVAHDIRGFAVPDISLDNVLFLVRPPPLSKNNMSTIKSGALDLSRACIDGVERLSNYHLHFRQKKRKDDSGETYTFEKVKFIILEFIVNMLYCYHRNFGIDVYFQGKSKHEQGAFFRRLIRMMLKTSNGLQY